MTNLSKNNITNLSENNITNLSKNKTSKKGEGGKGENLGSPPRRGG
jgi:hypothetical protein